jgi:excinuclease ABC subunit A
MEKPRYDHIRGLSPTISIEQKTTGTNPRSTVGTITEIADYLRVLYARIGIQHCHRCGKPVRSQTAEQIARELAALPAGTRLVLLAPVLVNRKGEHRELLAELRRAGYVRLRVDGAIVEAESIEALDKRRKHHVEVVVDRVVVGPEAKRRLTGSVEQALKAGGGQLVAHLDGADRVFSEKMACAPAGSPSPSSRPRASPSTARRACAWTATASAPGWRSTPSWWCRTTRSRSTRARSSRGGGRSPGSRAGRACAPRS